MTTEIPLLDEVNALINKERLLLSLQVLEKQQEAEDWKNKYDTLINNVAKTGDFRVLEIAALEEGRGDSQQQQSHNSSSSSSSSSSSPSTTTTTTTSVNSAQSLQLLLSELKYPWVLDVNGRLVEPALLHQIQKEVFNTRGTTSAVSTVLMSRSGLNDDCASGLGVILSRPSLLAADLSFNNLGAAFQVNLINALKVILVFFCFCFFSSLYIFFPSYLYVYFLNASNFIRLTE